MSTFVNSNIFQKLNYKYVVNFLNGKGKGKKKIYKNSSKKKINVYGN